MKFKSKTQLKLMTRSELLSYFRELNDIYTYHDLDLKTWLSMAKYLKTLENKYLQGKLF